MAAPLQVERMSVTVLDDPWVAVGVLRPSPPINPNPTTPLEFSRPAKVVWSAVGITLVLHIIVAAGLMVGPKSAARYQQNGLPMGEGSDGVEVISLLSIIPQEPARSRDEASLRATVDRAEEAVLIRKIALGAPNIKTPELKAPSIAIDSSEENGRTPQAIYRDQIRARIERAWYEIGRGSTRIGVGGCAVKIVQDSLGDVQQVQFQSCIALPAWKESLERAIRQASPLPAPPEEKIFSSDIELKF